MTKGQIRLNAILSQIKESKMNYEDLKNYLNYEDIFFNTILKPTADKYNLEISFNGKYIIFKKRGGKKNEQHSGC